MKSCSYLHGWFISFKCFICRDEIIHHGFFLGDLRVNDDEVTSDFKTPDGITAVGHPSNMT